APAERHPHPTSNRRSAIAQKNLTACSRNQIDVPECIDRRWVLGHGPVLAAVVGREATAKARSRECEWARFLCHDHGPAVVDRIETDCRELAEAGVRVAQLPRAAVVTREENPETCVGDTVGRRDPAYATSEKRAAADARKGKITAAILPRQATVVRRT